MNRGAHFLVWSGALAVPAINLTPQPPPPFGLAAWNRTGLTVDFAAKMTASGAPTWYATAQRSGTDTGPDEGELGMSASEEPITRLRVENAGNELTFNDNGALSLSDHYGAGGTTSAWTMRVQFADGTLVETNTVQRAGNGFLAWRIPNDGSRAVIAAVNDGTEFIIGAYQ